ncbi:MAG TPA: archease, partial [Pirellulales bacterium]|nr:archease [Pirellulales bacterium]
MYEVFEHTADLGLRVRAADPSALFANAALGLFSLIAPNRNTIRSVEQVTFAMRGEALDLLLFDWLAELLYVYETRHL